MHGKNIFLLSGGKKKIKPAQVIRIHGQKHPYHFRKLELPSATKQILSSIREEPKSVLSVRTSSFFLEKQENTKHKTCPSNKDTWTKTPIPFAKH